MNDLFSNLDGSDVSDNSLSWPNPTRFPTNLGQFQVQDQVLKDLRESRLATIVTGFASLDRIIDFVANLSNQTQVQLLVGSEPFESNRDHFRMRKTEFPKAVEEYWLNRGISLLLSTKIIRCIERLESGQVEARYQNRMHAKIYRGDTAITMGSSNFTQSGMTSQIEGNVRFLKEEDRFVENCAIADNLWQMAQPYSEQLITLLRQLLQVVSWQEAIARACAELLEGEWAQHYLDRDNLSGAENLWWHQRSGIAQALYILDKQGSVLVADATGSGKTRMGVHLMGAVVDRILRTNRMRQGRAILLSPANVVNDWRHEAIVSSTPVDVYSQGELSHSRHEGLPLESIRRAQVLCIDEGHNFLNIDSKRTRHILRNMADHVLMFTATPINKSLSDVISIINVLGADNLDDETLKVFRVMMTRKQDDYSAEEIALLRKTISHFTVRRTKKQLNDMVELAPERYGANEGRASRYPRHNPLTYTLEEPDSDRQLAAQIMELAGGLKAVNYFTRPIVLPEYHQRMGIDEATYLKSRLNSSAALARYNIASALRSSRAALYQHILGTKKALEEYKLETSEAGAKMESVFDIISAIKGKPPENRLSIDLPDWLSDPEMHRQACRDDMKIYYDIIQKLGQMSDSRERAKARQILSVMNDHDLVLAFDHRPISLAAIERLIREESEYDVLMATGKNTPSKARLIERFALGSEHKGVVGLASDALAESVNLQQASAVINLDLPSVIRIIEQRVGRVDRMNSPHDSIDVYWPDDAPEFALSSDQLLAARHEVVDNLLGSNMPLPEAYASSRGHTVSTQELIEEFESKPDIGEWDGVTDAFESVRGLISGEHALVAPSIYQRYRHITARVLSRVSLVKSKQPWAFFCLTVGAYSTPRWVFMSAGKSKLILGLDEIVSALRERLSEEVESIMALEDSAANQLNIFLGRLMSLEKNLLPRKNQRALIEMAYVLEKYQKQAAARQDQESLEVYMSLSQLLKSTDKDRQPDWDLVSTTWLDLVRPIWHEYLPEARKTIPMLKDIRKKLINVEADLGPRIMHAFDDLQPQNSLDERIRACIIGVDL